MSLARGQRLVLRRFEARDADLFSAYRSDPEVARYQSWEAMSRDQVDGFIAHVGSITPLMRCGHWVQVAIEDVSQQILIGDLGLFLSKDGREAEIGITLSHAAQGRGLGEEAVRLGCDLVWCQTQAQLIWGISDLRNGPSLRLLARCGFKHSHDETTDGVDEKFFQLGRPSGKAALA